MRVARRIRPSHVGCGATVNRRRLYAASFSHDTQTASNPARVQSLPPATFVIHANGQIVAQTGPFPYESEPERSSQPLTELAGSSARGRITC